MWLSLLQCHLYYILNFYCVFFLKEIILLLVMKDLDEDEMDPEDTGKGVNIRDRRVVIQSKKKTKW